MTLQSQASTPRRPLLRRTLRYMLWAGIVVFFLGAIASWRAFSHLTAPRHRKIGRPPEHMQAVSFPDAAGRRVEGWLHDLGPNTDTVLILHGIGGDRRAGLGRAAFLAAAGFSTLTIDLFAHGQSEGEHMSFGHFESDSARAAVAYLRKTRPSRKIASLGTSLGAAASVLGTAPLQVDAMILEQPYDRIEHALDNRLRPRLGPLASVAALALLLQGRWRLDLSPDKLRPIERVAQITCPVLVIAGDADLHTSPKETRAMHDAIRTAKEWWLVAGAAHTDLHLHSDNYERRVTDFLTRQMR